MAHGERKYIKSLLETEALVAKRSLGQNFLVDEAALDALIADVPQTSRRALELGAGLGSLSARLAQHFCEVKLIEIDRRLLPHLRARLAPYGPKVQIYEADLLSFSFAPEDNTPETIVYGNLPYYITQASLERIFTALPKVSEIRLVLQEEAIQRLLSGPQTKAYGPLNIGLALAYQVRRPTVLPAQAFVPPPRVRSGALYLSPRPAAPLAETDGEERAAFLAFAQFLFAERRKVLRQKLLAIAPEIDVTQWATARAESLSPDEFWQLYQIYGASWQKRGIHA